MVESSLKTKDQFGDIKEKEDSENIIAGGNKWACGNGRIDTSFIENNRHKRTNKCGYNDHTQHGNGDGDTKIEI